MPTKNGAGAICGNWPWCFQFLVSSDFQEKAGVWTVGKQILIPTLHQCKIPSGIIGWIITKYIIKKEINNHEIL